MECAIISSYLLAVAGGNNSPSAHDIENIFRSIDVVVPQEPLNKLLKELEGQNIEDIISNGLGKLPSTASQNTVAKAPDAVKNDTPEEPKERDCESAEDAGFDLFD